ncbi:YhjD/YihY/BrkB family envelope integrity protein [Streptomyces sp. HNM0645]|uniref:YhjD/YihY/BrkB family envelope integrity protein n=1 Tax=Streptomyces sp. HNM0645 TaxID=2782343 RepID=UPI0024B680A5|nr:YhjD/YihY/BrkB family envelope integrity protein [Streptomyces sp. HNM0645]MDI9885101.1 YhjD/YihY/BrkB family envelope integrity protein [Streptomyces sp. HNM0645]
MGGPGERGGGDLELMNRSLGFAAMGFLTLVPLMIVLAAADPAQASGFAHWLSRALSASTAAQPEIQQMFAPPRHVLRATTSFSLAALALFGVTFGAAVQTGYEKAWGLEPARGGSLYAGALARHVVWLCLVVGYVLVFTNTPLRRQNVITTPQGTAGAVLVTVMLLWASQKVLLGRRVGWRALLPGALATTVGLLGLRLFSRLVFSPLIVTSAVAYGPVGTMLVVQSWFVGVGFVIYGGALVGRILHEEVRPGPRRRHG